VDWFNDMGSGYNVMFLNTNAGGVSITLDSADEMVILDETHVPDDQEQLEDRNNNRNPEIKIKQRTYWYLKSLGTVEEAIARTNLVLDQQQKRFLDGRRGVEYMRQVMQEARELAQ
jgi:SNF2 family DNA or RNA helicase